MYVKELAAQANVSTHVVRYYTEIGLLTPERDPANAYRVYKPNDKHRLKFIRRARWLGFKLSDVRAILGDVDAGALGNDARPAAESQEPVPPDRRDRRDIGRLTLP